MRMPGRGVCRPILLTLAALSLAWLACGVVFAAGLANSPWPKFHRGQGNTGLAGTTATTSSQVKWSRLTGGDIEASPVIGTDGTVYIGSHDGKLYALDGDDGSIKWDFSLASGVASAPAIADDGTIYVATLDGKVYALVDNGTSASEKWTAFQRGTLGLEESYASPAIADDGTIYVAGEDGMLYAINPSNGLEVWRHDLGDWSDACPAIASDGTIYIGAGESLHAVTPLGAGKGGFPVSLNGTVISSSPVIGSDSAIYVGTVDGSLGYLHAITPAGAELWSFRADGPIYSSPAIDGDWNIYFGSDDYDLHCLSPAGDEVWPFPTGSWVDSSPAVGSDGIVYFGSNDGWFYAVDQTGSEVWSYSIGSEISFSSPAIGADGTVYVGATDGKVYAFKSTGGVRLAASDAYGTPGQADVPVAVKVDSDVTIMEFDFTLNYDQAVIADPLATDVSTALPGFSLTVTPGAGQIRVIGQSVAPLALVAGDTLATVNFDVLDPPGSNSSALTITNPSLLDDVGAPVPDVNAGAPGVFNVVDFTIFPNAPQTVVGSYLNFRLVGPGSVDIWVLTSKGSGQNAEIDPVTGVYYAGSQAGIDEVIAFIDGGQFASTEVTVSLSPPPPGTPAAPTSLDVDGGGVGITDVILILRAVVGLEQLTPEQEAAADFDGNGVGISDVITALRVVVGLPPVP
jgi:outer membrane protein assembly factor BamB